MWFLQFIVLWKNYTMQKFDIFKQKKKNKIEIKQSCSNDIITPCESLNDKEFNQNTIIKIPYFIFYIWSYETLDLFFINI